MEDRSDKDVLVFYPLGGELELILLQGMSDVRRRCCRIIRWATMCND